MVGGGFLDNIRSGQGWIQSKLPAVRGVLENVPHQYAQTGANVLKALGLKASAGVPGHGSETQAGPYLVLNSYHCSRLNTNTGRLTTPMFEDIFRRVREIIDEGRNAPAT